MTDMKNQTAASLKILQTKFNQALSDRKLLSKSLYDRRKEFDSEYLNQQLAKANDQEKSEILRKLTFADAIDIFPKLNRLWRNDARMILNYAALSCVKFDLHTLPKEIKRLKNQFKVDQRKASEEETCRRIEKSKSNHHLHVL